MAVRARRVVPVVGGVTAAATAVGAFAPAAHVAMAAPESVDANTGVGGALGLAQDGVFESCSANFGFGKEDGEGANAVAFEVTDVEGDDDATHAVGVDVDVILVIETESEETVECIPEEITQEDWERFRDNATAGDQLPDWPGPGHYGYPSVAHGTLVGEEDPQPATSVGFRVLRVPADHRLVSPEGIQPLVDHFEDVPDVDSWILAVQAAVDYTEPINLAGPVAAPEPPEAPPAPAAQPAVAAPTFTG